MCRLCSLTLMVCLTVVGSIEAQASAPIGQKVKNFQLQDFRGKSHQLSDFAENPVVVIAFLGTECPLAKVYGPRLAELSKKYAEKKVAFIGMMSNVHDSVTDIAAYGRLHGIEFPLLKDLGNKVADQMKAERTPEMFVLDQNRVIRYRGRIDDQYGIDYSRNDAKKQELVDAIDAVLAGEKVAVAQTKAPGCLIGRVREPNNESKVTYTQHIAPILQNRCVECHRAGEIGPFSLTKYDEVKGWAAMIAEVVYEQRMPPWHADASKSLHFSNDRSLTKEEKQQILTWVENGAPEGDPKFLPEPKKYASGWQLQRKPDTVINVQSKPFRVPARGTVRYQYFTVDPQFKEDKWFNAAQVLPGVSAVVHHVLVFAVDPKNPRDSLRQVGGGRDGFLVGYVPGSRVTPMPKGMAIRIPAGTALTFQVHYTPIGTEQFDQTKLAFWFVDPKTVTHEVVVRSAAQQFLKIPPRAEYHKEAATSSPLPACQLLSFMPHMHLRGRAFRYEVQTPDGQTKTVLDIPAYDFNWQTDYRLSEPLKLPAGSKVRCVAAYDNSEENLNNPNPNTTVYWGEQTWEEMMIGYFAYAVPTDVKNPEKAVTERPQTEEEKLRDRISQLVNRYDANKDGKLSRLETPLRFQILFAQLDNDNDGYITAEEAVDAIMKRQKKQK